jgi:iron(III) transport system permease protein
LSLIKQAGNNLIKIKRYSIILYIFAGIILIPVGIILFALFIPGTEIWNHIVNYLLPSYFFQTLILAIGVLVCASVIGILSAWIIVYYNFPLKNILRILLILPMAIPAYISAFTYAGILDYTGPVQVFFRNTIGLNEGYPVINIMNLPGAIFIMTMALYPYIYLPVQSAFRQQAGSINDASLVLGVSGIKLFFKVSLPLIRPALVGGGILVLMEVLNEYGAVHYFGVNTLSVGIFRAWFSLGDLSSAMKLSALLLLGVLTIIISERIIRGRIGFSLPSAGHFQPKKTSGWISILFIFLCSIPVLLGLLIPLAQLIKWALDTDQGLLSPQFINLIKNSFSLTGIASLIIITAAITSAHILRNPSIRWRRGLLSILTLGYAIPGTVIAIGIMIAMGFIDRQLNNILSLNTFDSGQLFLSGSLAALIIAYGIRFMGVAFNPIDAGFTQISGNYHKAARTLGRNSIGALFSVELPNIHSSIKAAGILVILDILKELPLTMILRPFNFNTLAVRAYEMASDERLAMAALPSLVIIIIGLISVLLLTTGIKKRRL